MAANVLQSFYEEPLYHDYEDLQKPFAPKQSVPIPKTSPISSDVPLTPFHDTPASSGYQDITKQSMDYEHAEMMVGQNFDNSVKVGKKERQRILKRSSKKNQDLVSLCRPTMMYPRDDVDQVVAKSKYM